MAAFGHVGEEDAHLAIFDTPADPAVLGRDPSRMAAAFGKAAFIEDEHWVERLVLRRCRHQWRRRQGLANQRTQLIAAALLIPDSTGEQALHPCADEAS